MEIKVSAGALISGVINDALKLAREKNCTVEFTFNEISVTVQPDETRETVRRTRNIEGPFILLELSDHLYPQCDLRDKLEGFIRKNQEWLKQHAAAELADDKPYSDAVRERLQYLANGEPA